MKQEALGRPCVQGCWARKTSRTVQAAGAGRTIYPPLLKNVRTALQHVRRQDGSTLRIEIDSLENTFGWAAGWELAAYRSAGVRMPRQV